LRMKQITEITDFSGFFSNSLHSQSIFKQFQIFLDIPGHIHNCYLHKYFQNF